MKPFKFNLFKAEDVSVKWVDDFFLNFSSALHNFILHYFLTKIKYLNVNYQFLKLQFEMLGQIAPWEAIFFFKLRITFVFRQVHLFLCTLLLFNWKMHYLLVLSQHTLKSGLWFCSMFFFFVFFFLENWSFKGDSQL